MPHDYAGDAEGFASAAGGTASSMAHLAQSLRSAAQQQQQQQQADREKAGQVELEIRRQGGTPFEPMLQQAPVKGGLIPRTPNPDYDPKNPNVYHDAWGRTWLMPDEAKIKKQEEQGKGLSQSLDASSRGALPVTQGQVRDPNDNTPRFAADESGNMTPRGYGLNVPATSLPGSVATGRDGQQFYAPTQDEKNNIGLRAELSKAAAEGKNKGWIPPKSVREHLESAAGYEPGGLEGVEIPHDAVSNAFTKALSPERADRKETHEDWVRIATDPSSKPAEVKRANAALDLEAKFKKKAGDPAAAEARAQRTEERRQRTMDTLSAQQEKLKEREDALHNLRQDWGDLMAEPDDAAIVDPETKKDVFMSAGRRKYYQGKIDSAASEISTIQQSRKRLIDRNTKLNGGDDSSEAAPAQAAPAQAAPAQGAGLASPNGRPTGLDHRRGSGANQSSQAPAAAQAPAQTPKTNAQPAKTTAQTNAQPTAAANPKANAKADAAKPAATMEQVRAYAKKFGLTEAEAVRRASQTHRITGK